MRTGHCDTIKKEGGPRDREILGKVAHSNPLVSIITVVYNGGEPLEQTIQSVINQGHVNIEYLIIDGGSTDGTLDIIRKYNDRITFWLSEPDRGIADAWNKGIREAKGEIVGIINAGDWYEADAVEQAVSAFRNNPEVQVVHGNMLTWEADRSEIIMLRKPLMKRFYSMRTPFNHPTMFVKKEMYVKFGLFDDQYRIAMDYDFMLRLILGGVKILYIDKVLANMCIGGISFSDMVTPYFEGREIIIKYGYGSIRANILMYYRIAERKTWYFLGLLGSHRMYMLYKRYMRMAKLPPW